LIAKNKRRIENLDKTNQTVREAPDERLRSNRSFFADCPHASLIISVLRPLLLFRRQAMRSSLTPRPGRRPESD
jgi:hypothetical protein